MNLMKNEKQVKRKSKFCSISIGLLASIWSLECTEITYPETYWRKTIQVSCLYRHRNGIFTIATFEESHAGNPSNG